MKKLAVVITHPIQYYVPVFRLLVQRGIVNVKVFYTEGAASINKFDPGFGKVIEWDIPLLEGYSFEWVENGSKQPGSYHYGGIVNPKLITMISEWKPDALLFFGWAYKSHLEAIRYFHKKIPVYFRGDSTLLDKASSIRSSLKLFFLKWVYSHIDCAFYVGTNNKAYFKKYGLREEQLIFAPHAVDNDRFYGGQFDYKRSIRLQFGIDKAATVVLFAGKLEAKKAPDQLLSAFLNLDLPNIHLLFTGNGELEKTLKQMAYGRRNIHFMDFQNQSAMPAVYQSCDLFCLPSTGPNETWGLSVNEAMACGKAILVSDKVGCAADLVKAGKNGAIFTAGDQLDLAEQLTLLLQHRDQLTEYGKKSREIIAPWGFFAIAEAIENKIMNEQI